MVRPHSLILKFLQNQVMILLKRKKEEEEEEKKVNVIILFFPINIHIFIKQLTRLLNLHLLQVIGEGEVTLIYSILPRFVTLIYNVLFL